MDEGIAAHLAKTPLTTIGLFSVTHNASGALRTAAPGYAKITGDVGRQVIREAHDRGTRVEIVYSSFGADRNRRLLGNTALQDKVIASLVAFVGQTGADGVNVDIEAIDPLLVPAYAGFVSRLRIALHAVDPDHQVSVATQANALGAAMAAGATEADADRIFLMAYDYRTGASDPGATSPIARRDGQEKDIPWSLGLYDAVGVPPERLLLGLPLYGVAWPVYGPEIGAAARGRGASWILRNHVDLLTDPDAVPQRDEMEAVEVYALGSDGSIGPPVTPPPSEPASGSPSTSSPSPGTSPSASAGPAATPASPPSTSPIPSTSPTWSAVYVDSPETLSIKAGIAQANGLAGIGFWAIGYERGLPGYTDLMHRFADGETLP
jgi:spore germination protein YaaH